MQKLLRLSPSSSSSTPILCTAAKPLFHNTSKPLLSLHFKNKPINPSYYNKNFISLIAMPAAAAAAAATSLHTNGCGSALGAFLVKRPSFTAVSSRFSSASDSNKCYICRCSVDSRAAVRAWIVFKDGKNVSRPAWLHTGSDGSFADTVVESAKGMTESLSDNNGEEEGKERVPEENPLRFNRRQRGTSSGGGSVALTGNPDLLTIPGVGPRNLRKLVDKGIGGVTELKQLYKDRVEKEL